VVSVQKYHVAVGLLGKFLELVIDMIQQLRYQVSLEQLQQDLDQVLLLTQWHYYLGTGQIGLTHQPGALLPWQDAVGARFAGEELYSEFNDLLPPTLKAVLEGLAEAEGIQIGRTRFWLMPASTHIVLHRDLTVRYHLSMKTHKDSYFVELTAGTDLLRHHVPADGFFYRVDTTRNHAYYNRGSDESLHLVIIPR
jgi:hypothetical protein